MTKYEIKNTTQFKKDYKLANGEPLDAKYKDHQLSGNWIGHRECHFNRTGFWSIVMKMMYLYLHVHILELIATCLIYKD